MERDFYREYFAVEDRHWWFIGRRRILLDVLERRLGPAPGRHAILDVGSGTGTMIEHLSRFGDVRGVDFDPEAIRFCRERGVQAVERIEGDRLPFADGSFDVVTSFDVLEHIEDDGAMLAEMHRVLRPGGTLLLAVPALPFLWGPQDEISHHHRRYRHAELGAAVTAAGFRLERLTYFNTLLFPPIAAVRVLGLNRGSGEAQSDFRLVPGARVNRLLARLFGAEARLLRRRDLPIGVSLLALAERP